MKLDATAYFQCAKDDVKSVKRHTKTWYFAEKNTCFYEGNKTSVKDMWITLPTYWYNVLYTRMQFIMSNTKEECNF